MNGAQPNRRPGTAGGTAPRKYVDRRTGNSGAGAVTWGSLDAEELRHFIDTVAEYGACCILGKTGDGGALALTVLADGNRWRVYKSSADDMLAELSAILGELAP